MVVAVPTGATGGQLTARSERALRRGSPRATPRADPAPKPKAKATKAKAANPSADGSSSQRTARVLPKKRAKSSSGASTARTERDNGGKPASLQMPADDDGERSRLPALNEESSPNTIFDKLEAAELSSSSSHTTGASSRRRTVEGSRRRTRVDAAAHHDAAPEPPLFKEEQLAGAAQKAVAVAAAELAVTGAASGGLEAGVSAVGTESVVPKLAASAVAAVAASAALPSLQAESLSMRMAARRMEKQQLRANRRRPSLDVEGGSCSSASAAAATATSAAAAAFSSSSSSSDGGTAYAAGSSATTVEGVLPGSSSWQPPPQRINARLDAELAKMREERSKREERLFAQLDRLSSSSGAIASTAHSNIARGGSSSSSSTALITLSGSMGGMSTDTRLATVNNTSTLASGESIRSAELLKMLRSKASRRWLRQWLEQPGRVEQVRAIIEQAPAPLRSVLVDVLSRILHGEDEDEEDEGARITMLGRHAMLMKKRGDVARRESTLERTAHWALQDRTTGTRTGTGDVPLLLEGPRMLTGPPAPLLLELKS
jgi:hypothetical protein